MFRPHHNIEHSVAFRALSSLRYIWAWYQIHLFHLLLVISIFLLTLLLTWNCTRYTRSNVDFNITCNLLPTIQAIDVRNFVLAKHKVLWRCHVRFLYAFENVFMRTGEICWFNPGNIGGFSVILHGAVHCHLIASTFA